MQKLKGKKLKIPSFSPLRKTAICFHHTCQVVQVLLDNRMPNYWNSTIRVIFYLTIYCFLLLFGHFFQPQNNYFNNKKNNQTISYITFRCRWLQFLQQFCFWKQSCMPSYTLLFKPMFITRELQGFTDKEVSFSNSTGIALFLEVIFTG